MLLYFFKETQHTLAGYMNKSNIEHTIYNIFGNFNNKAKEG